MTAPTIDATLLQAYRDTEYRVHGNDPFTLRIGHPSPAPAAAHKQQQVRYSAYITAFNPFSMALGDARNEERHADLARELNNRRLIFIEGVGQHPSNEWPGEASYLVFGLTLAASKILGVRLEQNAIVWSGADATPQLVTLK